MRAESQTRWPTLAELLANPRSPRPMRTPHDCRCSRTETCDTHGYGHGLQRSMASLGAVKTTGDPASRVCRFCTRPTCGRQRPCAGRLRRSETCPAHDRHASGARYGPVMPWWRMVAPRSQRRDTRPLCSRSDGPVVDRAAVAPHCQVMHMLSGRLGACRHLNLASPCPCNTKRICRLCFWQSCRSVRPQRRRRHSVKPPGARFGLGLRAGLRGSVSPCIVVQVLSSQARGRSPDPSRGA